MEGPEQSSKIYKGSDEAAPDSPRERPATLLGYMSAYQEIAAAWVVFAAIAVFMDMGTRRQLTPEDRQIGTVRLTVSASAEIPADENLAIYHDNLPLDAVTLLQLTGTADLRSLTPVSEPEDTVNRVRLGDTRMYRSDERAVLVAAVLDERLVFGEPSVSNNPLYDPVQSPVQSNRDIRGDAKTNFDAEGAVERSVPNAEDAPGGGGPVRARDTTREIVMSATMTALLRAEAMGLSSLSLVSTDLEFTAGSDELIDGIYAGILSVERHLTTLQTITLHTDSPLPDSLMDKAASALDKVFYTPYAWPGGEAFYMPAPIPDDGLPADTASVFNGASKTDPPTSPFPFILLFAGMTGAFALRLRSIPSRRRSFNYRGMILGGGCGVLVFVVAYSMRYMWHTGPGQVVGSLPALLSVALAAGIGLGAATGWIRVKMAHEALIETRPDNVLRSVLHPDKPIESIKEDRLGFAPVVDSLRRFLDNKATTPPVVLSINGPWGSGKSSVMKMLQTELKMTDRFRTVWFNAWRYHKEEQILAAFLKTISRDLRREGWSARLAWARLRRYSIWQLLLLLAPIAVVVVALILNARGEGTEGAERINKVFSFLTLGNDSVDAETLISVLGIGGPLVWLARMAVPFQLQFRRLYARRDQSKRIGFLDEFSREFDLYREAVGGRKFVIFIDDLDRCPPDKIVDVLKTINLITTSGRAASTTFFVLGYDPKYITRSIELHFKEFTRSGTAIDRHFGAEYLKKMVTLSVSVPTPSADARTSLARRLGGAEQESADDRTERWTDHVVRATRSVPGWVWRMAASVSIAALCVVLAVNWKPPADVNRDPSVTQADDTTTVNVATASNAEFILSIDAMTPMDPDRAPWWAWAIPMALVIISGSAIYIRSRPTSAEIKYVRPPEDTEQFIQAVEDCKTLLPENPRDVVRVLNLMRMQYLVQRIGADKMEKTAEVQPLNEWECVSYSVLQQRYPQAFSYGFVHGVLVPALRENGHEDVPDFYEKSASKFKLPETFVSDVTTLDGTDRGVAHMADPDKLDRYVHVNRYVLDAAGELISTDPPAPTGRGITAAKIP